MSAPYVMTVKPPTMGLWVWQLSALGFGNALLVAAVEYDSLAFRMRGGRGFRPKASRMVESGSQCLAQRTHCSPGTGI